MQISFVRRLDELGRIVIPKELRNKLNFNVDDMLDLSIGNDSLIIKKAKSSINQNYVLEIINLVEYLSDYDIIVTNSDKVIAKSSNITDNLLNCDLSEELNLLKKEHKSKEYLTGLQITKNFFLENHIYVKSIIKDSNVLGLLIIRVKNNIEDINLFLNLLTKLLLQ